MVPLRKFPLILLLLFFWLGLILPKLLAVASNFPADFPGRFSVQSKSGQKIQNGLEIGNSAKELSKCAQRRFSGTDSFVCVCNGTFCDQPEPVGQLEPGKAVLFLSDPLELRLNRTEVPMARKNRKKTANSTESLHIRVDASRQYQTILGFGGAFTDAVGYNLNTLANEKTRQNLLKAYFEKETGIGYTLGRVPIASCDFSMRPYSYCDTSGDFALKTFALAKEDLEMKIPHIQTANQLSDQRLRLFASPWSAPGWMKTTGKMKGGGSLRGNLDGPYYRSYAHYFRRFFEEYARLGNISFWGLTIENEPQYGEDLGYLFQAMWVSPDMQRDFANQLLGPVLRGSPASANVLIMAHDDDRGYIFDAAQKIFKQNSAATGQQKALNSSVAGLAFHWYNLGMHTELSRVHSLYPDRFLLSTEACTGWTGNDRGVSLGNWTRGWMYGRDILQDMRSWAVGWTDWNFCLDTQGGPNWVRNFVDSPVIVNASADEFYKQPMFYAIAHFSRFVPPGSVRIDSQLVGTSPLADDVEFVAFRTPNGDRVLVFISSAERPVEAVVEEQSAGAAASVEPALSARILLPARAFGTLIWPKQ